MAALLVSLALMGLLMSMALPVWSQQARREREAELIFRGEQYARAIALYQRRQPGAFPSDLDTLVEGRYLRRRYGDPMRGDAEFRVLRQTDQEAPGSAAFGEDRSAAGAEPGAGRGSAASSRSGRGRDDEGGIEGGIIGVVSRSTEASLRTYNGRQRYDEWEFTYLGAGTEGDGDPMPGLRPEDLGGRRGGSSNRLGADLGPGDPLGPGR
ncbi:MAG: hypothetical protein OXH69_17170 [Acidobacteria bacterium]|nr:hypothetical protein [Acidobacteriota bacterium]